MFPSSQCSSLILLQDMVVAILHRDLLTCLIIDDLQVVSIMQSMQLICKALVQPLQGEITLAPTLIPYQ